MMIGGHNFIWFYTDDQIKIGVHIAFDENIHIQIAFDMT